MFGKRFSTASSSSRSSTDTLTSMTSTTTATSTSTLLPSVKNHSSQTSRTEKKKDYLAAQAALQSSYGSAGVAPHPSFAAVSKKNKSKAKQADETTSAKPQRKDGKDWEAAYGALCSQYGFGAPVPVLPTTPKSKK